MQDKACKRPSPLRYTIQRFIYAMAAIGLFSLFNSLGQILTGEAG